jgi:nicotinamide-nucleotide amidase
LIAALLGQALHENPAVLAHVAEYFNVRKRPRPESTKIQALAPEGATVLMNAFGTAPGLVLEAPPGKFRPGPRGSLLVMLPGPPRELRPMFTNQVLPLIKEKFPLANDYCCLTLKTTGIGESRVEEIIAPRLAPLCEAGLEVGYCARTGEVDVRLTARGQDAAAKVNQAAQIVQQLLPRHVYGEGDTLIEEVVVRLLTERRQTVALAESCTGGFIAHRLTNISGASAVLWGGMVTYANEAKQNLLEVSADLLAAHGAVSEPVARAMAEGARRRSGADYAIAVTGIAGPTGGTPAKPVGTVFIALAGPAGTQVRPSLNQYDRETFKFVTAQQALEMLRRAILGITVGE